MILLIDFTCTVTQSHNWDSLFRFKSSLLKENTSDVTICIPSINNFSNRDTSQVYNLKIDPFKQQLSGKSHRLRFFEFLRVTYMIHSRIRKLLIEKRPSKLIWINAEAASLLAGIFLSILNKEVKFYYRFIGWAEFWTPFNSVLLKFILRISRLRRNIFLAFETKSLRHLLGEFGAVIPYPIQLKGGTVSKDSKNILLLGSGRREKGFDEIYEFALELSKTLPAHKIILQEAATPWNNYAESVNKLKSLANVQLMPAILDRIELDNLLQNCQMTILPYDRSLYKHKGSASLFEAVEYQKPIIAYEGCGFSSDVDDFYLGLLALDVYDLARCVKTLEESTVNNYGFTNYAKYSELSFKKWVGWLEK